MHAFDESSGIIFYSQVSLNAIGCWNTAVPLKENNFHIIAQDNETMIYPSDINVIYFVKFRISNEITVFIDFFLYVLLFCRLIQMVIYGL